MERVTHSHFWDLVAPLRPRLRTGVVVHRRHFRRRRGYVVQDAAANQFFRLDAVTFHLIGLLDGRRTVEQAWECTVQRFGEAAPTQGEVVSLLGQLAHANLVAVEAAGDAAELFERMRRRRSMRLKRGATSLLFVKIPLFNPAVAIDWLLPLVRPLLGRLGLLLWFVVVAIGAAHLLLHWPALWREAGEILRPSNLPWLAAVFVCIKAMHEFGHGVLCRHFGGEVHEMGIMLLVFAPVPYCDATSSWGLPGRRQRALVGLGGIFAETAVAAMAAVVWAHTSGGRLHEVAHNTVILSGIGTLLFNANPLLRYDGYHVLSDLLDIPNLLKTANEHLKYVAQRYLFGVTDVRPVTRSTVERFWLSSYAILAWCYRLMIMFGIAWFVSRLFFGLGVILAALAVLTWVVVPLLGLMRYLAASPALAGHRARAVTATLAIVALLGTLTGVVPVRERAYADAVVRAPESARLVVGVNGFVEQVGVQDGEAVQPGEIVLRTRSHTLVPRQRAIEAEIAAERVLGDAAGKRQDAAARAQSAARLAALSERLGRVQQQIDDQTLRCAGVGVVVAPHLGALEGAYVRRGAVVGEVRGGRGLQAAAMIDQLQSARLLGARVTTAVQVRTVGSTARVVEGRVAAISPAGHRRLRHALHTLQGGGEIRTDPTDPSGLRARQALFEVMIDLPADAAMHPGQRAKVRFTMGRTTVAARCWRRLLQLRNAG